MTKVDELMKIATPGPIKLMGAQLIANTQAQRSTMEDIESIRKQQKAALIATLIDGLTYDGGHHKQYYLEDALHHVCTREEFEMLKETNDWEEGIPS